MLSAGTARERRLHVSHRSEEIGIVAAPLGRCEEQEIAASAAARCAWVKPGTGANRLGMVTGMHVLDRSYVRLGTWRDCNCFAGGAFCCRRVVIAGGREIVLDHSVARQVTRTG